MRIVPLVNNLPLYSPRTVKTSNFFDPYITLHMGRDSSVGIFTLYGMDGPGTESRWGGGEIFCIRPDRPGTHPASYTMGTGSFPGVKRPWRGAEVEERVELYMCSRSEPSWPVLG